VFLVTAATAQKIDSSALQKIDKELLLMKSILNEMFISGNPDPEIFDVAIDNTIGTYIPGYGMVFKAPDLFIKSFLNEHISVNYDSLENICHQRKLALLSEFAEHYTKIISSLLPSEKILIYYDDQARRSFYYSEDDSIRLLVENKRSNQIVTYIVNNDSIYNYTSSLPANTVKKIGDTQNNVLAAIFRQRLVTPQDTLISEFFKVDFKDSYIVSYYSLNDFGVLYNIKLIDHSSTIHYDFQREIIELAKSNSAWQQNVNKALLNKDQIFNDGYVRFKTILIEDILKYGKTLSNLSVHQALVMNIELPNCLACNVPAQMVIKVSGGTLHELAQRDINVEEAIKQCLTIELGKASERIAGF
ncbi:MAG: hypothetical protein AAF632_29205, partial [Bacteroidota bacterium]